MQLRAAQTSNPLSFSVQPVNCPKIHAKREILKKGRHSEIFASAAFNGTRHGNAIYRRSIRRNLFKWPCVIEYR